jgi:predicted O-methyltransferase YrrM
LAYNIAAMVDQFRGGGTGFSGTALGKKLLSDQGTALDSETAALCYLLSRSLDARRVVELGTSLGLSTIYLASALRDNARTSGGKRIVISTESEPARAAAARRNFAEAGISAYVDLREGDLQTTLREIESPVDLVLVDTSIPLARPALELIVPKLRPGAIVLCDNTVRYARPYADYLDFVRSAGNGFLSMTLPMRGGLELSVRIR